MRVILDNAPYLFRGALNTLWLSVISIAVSTVLGTLFGVASAFRLQVLRQINTVAVWIVRGVPLLVVLFAAYFSTPPGADPYVAATGALSLYFTFFVSEAVRGAILAVPRGQHEAGKGIGLSFWKRVRLIILPQAFRAALPPIVNLCVVLVKGTAYASVISVWELTTASGEVAQRTVAPFQIYGFAMAIYFFICFPLTHFGRVVERRLAYKH